MIKKIFNKIVHNKIYGLISVFIFLIVGISLGSAILTKTLKIVGKTKIDGCGMNIYFDNIELNPDSVKNADTSKDARIVGSGKQDIEFSTNLSSLNEMYEFTVYTVNNGCLDVMIDSVEKTGLTEELKEYVSFDVVYDDSNISVGDTYYSSKYVNFNNRNYYVNRELSGRGEYCDPLFAGTRRKIKVTVKLKKELEDDNPLSLDLGFKINYVQEYDCLANTLTIDPNGGTYDETAGTTKISLNKDSEYTVLVPKKGDQEFLGWEVISPEQNGTYTFEAPDANNKRKFIMGDENVIIRATWNEEVKEEYVATIGFCKYYTSIQNAFNDVDKTDKASCADNRTVYLLKSTTETATNVATSPFTFNLQSYTVTGTIINPSDANITLTNGRIIAVDDNDDETINAAVKNYGILTLSDNTDEVQVENTISLKGFGEGVSNFGNAKLNFYDGYIEAIGGIAYSFDDDNSENSVVTPEHYSVVIDSIQNGERAYITNDPNRKVAKTMTNGPVFYETLQLAIASSTRQKELALEKGKTVGENYYKIYAIRDFPTPNEVQIEEGSDIYFDLSGYNVSFGNDIVNDGKFNIINSSNETSLFSVSNPITNNGMIKINGVNLNSTTSFDVISNYGYLNIDNSTITSIDGYGITNNENIIPSYKENDVTPLRVKLSNTTVIQSNNNYGIYNTQDDLVLDSGTVYGLYNISSAEIKDNAILKTSRKVSKNEYIAALANTKNSSITINGGDITSNEYTDTVLNAGTITMNSGNIYSVKNAVKQELGGRFYGEFILNDGNITSSDSTLYSGTITLNGGTVHSISGTAIYAKVFMNGADAKVISDEGSGIDASNDSKITNGTITAKNNGIITESTLYIEGGHIKAGNIGIHETSSNTIYISGGEIEGKNIGVYSTYIIMTDGKITGSVKNFDGDTSLTTSIGIKGGGKITGGEVYGDLYGVLGYGREIITLGTDDYNNKEPIINNENPVIRGGSYGVYASEFNFYDGVVEGEISGYSGTINGSPQRTIVTEIDPIVIDERTYRRFIIDICPNWLKVGDVEYNNLDAASSAIDTEGTIEVIADAYLGFEQSILDNENKNKKITFDLNGHTITTTQSITNNVDLTIVDSSDNKTGTVVANTYQESSDKFIPHAGIVNKNILTINGGIYTGTANTLIENKNEMVVENATFNCENQRDVNIDDINAIYSRKTLTVNDITINNAKVGIYDVGTTMILNDGEINANNYGIRTNYSQINGGTINSNSIGISGNYVTVDNGTITSNGSYAIQSDNITVNNGIVTSNNNTAIYGITISINGGTINGVTGISVLTNDSSLISINGGKINATNYGISISKGNLSILGGEIKSDNYGIYMNGSLISASIGEDDNIISVNSPKIIGDNYAIYADESSYRYSIKFYDGILMSKDKIIKGFIYKIPNNTMIKDDYEYIGEEKYNAQYLSELENWIRVGSQEFSSINDAVEVMNNGDTMTVIANPYVGSEQVIPSDKDVYLDLNGYSIIVTTSIKVEGKLAVIDGTASGTNTGGSITSERDFVFYNDGELVIDNGGYSSGENYTIYNNNKLTMNGGIINSAGGVYNAGSNGFTMNNGTIKANGVNKNGSIKVFTNIFDVLIKNLSLSAIYSSQNLTINNGTIKSFNDDMTGIVATSGELNINGGSIYSEKDDGIEIYGSNIVFNMTNGFVDGYKNGINLFKCDSATISGGEINSSKNGIFLNAQLVVTGGKIYGELYGISASSSSNKLTLGVDDGNINITSPEIKSKDIAIYGRYNFYDGILVGNSTGENDDVYDGEIDIIPSNTELEYGSRTEDGETFITLYLRNSTEKALNVQTGEKYKNLQDAIDEALENQTIKILVDFSQLDSIDNNNSNKFTIDLDGHKIITNKVITNNGELDIISGSQDRGIIQTRAKINLFVNNGKLKFDNVNVVYTQEKSNDYVVIMNRNELTLNNFDTSSKNNTIKNDSKLTINNSIIKSTDDNHYAIKGTTTQEINISNSNISSMNVTNNLNAQISNQYTLNNVVVDKKIILTNATLNIINNSRINGSIDSRKSTVNINNSYLYDNYLGTSNLLSYLVSISNDSTFNISNSTIDLSNSEFFNKNLVGILNNGTLNVDSSTLNIGGYDPSTVYNKTYEAIEAKSGTTIIQNTDINVTGGKTAYGINLSGQSTVSIPTGTININRTTDGYGIFAQAGFVIIGEDDDVVYSEKDVYEEPRIYVSASQNGIGIKKTDGAVGFFDGIVYGSSSAIPEIITSTTSPYEVTTYIEESTGFQYSVLENINDDYIGDAVAILKSGNNKNDIYYNKVQDAINKATENDEILLLRSTIEDLVISKYQNIKLNLNGKSITTTIINNGTLNVYNGLLQNIDETVLNNNGTFIMGKNDNNISSSSIKIASETKAVINNGTFKMYDGYIDGNPPLEGEIDEIAEQARLYEAVDAQKKRIYIQGLSEESILNGDVDLILTIDPNGGTFNGSNDIQKVYLKHGNSYSLNTPTKDYAVFAGWESTDPDALDNNLVTMNLRDVKVTAIWNYSNSVVARIDNEYYTSLSDAIADANSGDVIVLLKDTSESISISNTKNIKIDLGTHKIGNQIINNGTLQLTNGTIENTNGPAIINNGTLILGENDETIDEDLITIISNETGIEQNGILKMYDGTIELLFDSYNPVSTIRTIVGQINELALNGTLESGHYSDMYSGAGYYYTKVTPFVEGEYVATVLNGTTGNVHVSLDNAIEFASDGDTLIILKGFTHNYDHYLSNLNKNISINLNGQNIVLNYGINIRAGASLKLFDTQNSKGTFTTNSTITNNGNLEIDDITLQQTVDNVTITNNGNLTLNNSTITSTTANTIETTGTLNILNDTQVISNGGYAISNDQDEKLTISSGTISSINNSKELELDGNVTIENNSTAKPAINLTGTSSLVMKNGTINSNYIGIVANSNNNITIKNGNIATSNNSILINFGCNGSIVNIEGGKIESSQASALYADSRNTSNIANISGGTLIGNTNAIIIGQTLNISGGKVITNSLSSSDSALVCNGFSNCTISDSAIFEADRASGIDISNEATISGGEIYVGAKNGIGLKIHSANKTINISGNTKIETQGILSTGIDIQNSITTVVIDNINLISENIGINYKASQPLTINGGSISGNTYGIYVDSNDSVLNIGNESDDNLSITNPYISGGTYGVYINKGIANFYNGKLRGSTKGYRGEFNHLKDSMDIIEVRENDTTTNEYLTYSTNNSSINPISDVAKEGNGYARITYIGNSESCDITSPFEYDYKGLEVTFKTPCTGKYKLEVWGAQGGTHSNNYPGGYGGYSYGEINLSEDELLYINVGGKGNLTPTTANSIALGGYNGGGDAINSSTDGTQIGSGGGATSIATSSGLLSKLSNDRNYILIVAGGGGGVIFGSKRTTSPGHGGGYQGATSIVDSYYAQGGTQESGYAFGQAESVEENDRPGAGGGYYSGYSRIYTAGGGSGYIGSNRLDNAYMYGYNVKTTISDWINNYLTNKDDFLQVGTETFNSINAAVEYIENNIGNTGTIIVLSDSNISQESLIPSGMNITLDLKGHNLNITTSIINNGILNITNTDGVNNYIDSKIGDTIINNGKLTVSNVQIKSSSRGINVSSTNNEIILNNIKCNTSGACVYLSTGSGNDIQITDSQLTSTSGANLESSSTTITDNNSISIIDSTLSGQKYSLNLTQADVEIKNTTLTAQEESVINLYNCSADILNNSKIQTSTIKGLTLQKSNVTISNSEISIDGNKYAIDIEGSNDSDASSVTINGSIVKSNSNAIYYVGKNSTLNVNNSDIISYENSAIKFSNVSYDRTLNINSGNIIGKTYGIHVIGANTIVNIGSSNYNLNDEPSTENPFVSGDSYGIYKEAGTTNFYEGKIRGKEDGYSGDFNAVRSGMKIYDTFEFDTPGDMSTKYIVNYLGEQEGYLKVGNSTYNSFDKALAALGASQSGTIKVVGNVLIQDNVVINGNDIVLDLNGHKITLSDSMTNNANLTISDSQTDGTLKGVGSSVITNNSTLTLSGGTIEGSQNGIFTNITGSTLNITGGNIETPQYAIYYNTAGYNNTINISGGTIVSTGSSAIYSDGASNKMNTFNISGGTITGATDGSYLKYAKGNITGGTFSTSSSDVSKFALSLSSCSNLYLKTGSIISANNASGLFASGGTIYLQGVQINNKAENSIGFSNTSTTVNISDNTIINSDNMSYGMKINSGTITITDIDIDSENIGIHSAGGTLNLNGGVVKGLTYGILQTSTSKINFGSSSGSTISTENPSVTGELYGIYRGTSGQINYYNGILRGKSGIINSQFDSVRSGYYVKEELDANNYYAGTLTPLVNVVRNTTTGTEYTTLKAAVNDLKTGEELELIGNVYNYDAITFKTGITATLDLKGYSISTSKAITNNSILTIKSTGTKGRINSGINIILITNNNTLTIQNTYLSSGGTCIKNNSSKVLGISNSDVISNTTAIENNGDLSVDYSTISGTSYGINSNTSINSTITNSTIISENNAIYKNNNSTNTTTITDSIIDGKINIQKNNESLIINNGDLRNGYISNIGTIAINGNTMTNYYISYNSGNLTMQNITFNYTRTENATSDEKMILNSGIMTISNNTISYIDNSETTKKLDLIYNSGTITSTNNTLNINCNNHTRELRGIYNSKIFNSDNDNINIIGGNKIYGLYYEGTNNSILEDINIDVSNSLTAYGIYKNNASSSLTIKGDSNITVSDSTTSYGIYLNNGIINFEKGKIQPSGTNSYGVYLQNGTFTIGIEDTSGNEAADVSITDPFIKAVGTTTGKGIVKNSSSTLNMYDGYICGSTAPFDNTITFNNVQSNYHLSQKYDNSTGYYYYILEHN